MWIFCMLCGRECVFRISLCPSTILCQLGLILEYFVCGMHGHKWEPSREFSTIADEEEKIEFCLTQLRFILYPLTRPHSVMNAFYSQLIYWSSNLIIWNFRYSDLCWQWVSFLGGELIISSLIMQRKDHQRTICGKGQVKVAILSFALIFYPRFSIKVQQRERPKTKLPILSQCFESTHLIMDSERVVVELLG